MLQVLCSFPLQMLPAARVVVSWLVQRKRLRPQELLVFEPTSDPPWSRKMAKTGFRFMLVCLFALVAFLGASHLDNFVSLIGALCGVPLPGLPLVWRLVNAQVGFHLPCRRSLRAGG